MMNEDPTFTITLTPKGINALILDECNCYAALAWWKKMLQYRASRKKMNHLRPGVRLR